MHSTGHGGPLSSPGAGWAGGSGGLDAVDAAVFEALARHIPPALIEAALIEAALAETAGRRRRRWRKVPAHAAVWLVIAVGLWGDRDVPSLRRQVVGVLASLPDAPAGRRPPCKSALSRAEPGPVAAGGPAGAAAPVRRRRCGGCSSRRPGRSPRTPPAGRPTGAGG
jgi:hypothetical protein